jgi:ketosteroid isomerase-like protein
VGDDIATRAAFDRLVAALQRRDIDGLMSLFGDTYTSEQPLHPARDFSGVDQVRRNWSTMFAEIPDFTATLLRSAIAGDVAWSEWHWTGTALSGKPLDEMGVALFGFRDGRIAWGRLYIEPVERGGADVDAQVSDRVAQP